jgi:hypothetical protein
VNLTPVDASEGLSVFLLVFRRDSRRLSMGPRDWPVALGGTFTVLLVRPATMAIAMEPVGIVLQIAVTLFAIYGKVSLGRIFGLVAANRGIISGGPNHIVNHSIYHAYHWNTTIYMVLYFF